MIDLTISVRFSIINLTGFEWSDLQFIAQRIADDYAFHTVPESFSFSSMTIQTHGDQDLSVLIRRKDNALEFIFIQPNLLSQVRP